MELFLLFILWIAYELLKEAYNNRGKGDVDKLIYEKGLDKFDIGKEEEKLFRARCDLVSKINKWSGK